MTVLEPTHTLTQSRRQVLLNCLLFGLWMWLFRPIFPYLTTIFTRQDFRVNQIALMILVAVFVYKGWEEGLRVDFGRKPRPHRLPLLFMLGGAGAFVFFERFLDINNLSAGLLVIATYGLVGLYMQPQTWRNGLPIMLLIGGTLPVNHHIDTFIGYPMRIASAVIVRDLFAAAGVGSLGVNTILVFENGVANIDIPCSGAQSLWTGAMFLLMASWLERKRLELRWIVTALLMVVLLFLSNLTRIAALVLSGQVLGWTPLAEMLHVPLGLLGFIGACMVTLALLRRWVPAHTESTPSVVHAATQRTRRVPLTVMLLVAMVVLGLFHKPYVRANVLTESPGWDFPAALNVTEQPLDSYQLEWLLNDGADSADRWSFEHGGLSGSMLFVVASNWHAHHNPEGCFSGTGLETQESRPELIADDFPVRWLTLAAPDGTQYSAVFWFQSAEMVTDDYATRIWDDLRFERNKWVLVSSLFDGTVDVNSAETAAYLQDLRATAQTTLDRE